MLSLCNNLIYRLGDVSVFLKCNPALINLNLSNNSISEMKAYRILALNRLDTVRVLDGKPVLPEERLAAVATSSSITDELLWECSRFLRASEWSSKAKSSKQRQP